MREYSTPPTVAPPVTGNLTDAVVENARTAPGAVVLSRRDARGEPWRGVTTARFLAEVREVAAGLVAAGLAPGDRVAVLGRTSYGWTLVDHALWFAGLVPVPLYESSPLDLVRLVLADAGVAAALVDGPVHAERLRSVDPDLPVWAWDDGGLADLVRDGAQVDDATLERRRTTAGPGDPATIVYTSGTTGRPRGCVLTHANLEVAADTAVSQLAELFGDGAGGPGEADATLLFLPLAHVFARVVQVGCVRSRTRLGHSGDVRHLAEDLADFRPTFLLAVPRVFEQVFNTASQRATADGRGPAFDRGVEAAIAWSRGRERGRTSLRARVEHAALTRPVRARLQEALGGRCRYAVSGGAPLGERLTHFFRGVGVTVLEGWGLTETTAAVTVNLPGAHRIGTVGRPLPGTAVRVADDGELLVRGPQVFPGYWRDAAATAEVVEPDGWLHTGDVGEVDDEGFVRVTGRRREILVTAGGKSVSPTVLEERLRAHPLVSQALVVGDGRPFVGALVTIDEESFAAWAAPRGLDGSVARHVDDPALRAAVQDAVDEANRAVSRAESVRAFAVLPADWTEEAGHLTPSLKLRRSVVARDFRDDIASLYRA